MEPALRAGAAIGPEDRLPRERRRTGQRVRTDQERVVHAVELDGLAERRVDHARAAEDGRGVATDAIEAIEGPGLGHGRGLTVG